MVNRQLQRLELKVRRQNIRLGSIDNTIQLSLRIQDHDPTVPCICDVDSLLFIHKQSTGSIECFLAAFSREPVHYPKKLILFVQYDNPAVAAIQNIDLTG
ncbi:hypothetical protein D3C76_1302240 [compost metagenome]